MANKLPTPIDYDAIQSKIAKRLAFLEGTDNIGKYLNRIPFEEETINANGKEQYNARKAATKYRNYVGGIASHYVGSLLDFTARGFADQVPEIEAMQKDFDGKGKSFDSFIQTEMASHLYYADRACYVIDRPEEGGACRIHTIEPSQIVDMDMDKSGNVQFLLYTATIEERPSPFEKKKQYEMAFFYFYNEGVPTVAKWRKDVQSQTWLTVSEEPIDLSVLPVVAIQIKKAYGADLFNVADDLYNTQSIYRHVVKIQGIGMRIYKLASGNEDQTPGGIIGGGLHMFTVNDGEEIYQLDPLQFPALRQEIDELILDLYRISSGMVRKVTGDSKQVQSADSMREESKSEIKLKSSKIEIMEDCINQILEVCAEFLGVSLTEDRIQIRINEKAPLAFLVQLYQTLRPEIASSPMLRTELLSVIINEAAQIDASKIVEITGQLDGADREFVEAGSSALRSVLERSSNVENDNNQRGITNG